MSEQREQIKHVLGLEQRAVPPDELFGLCDFYEDRAA